MVTTEPDRSRLMDKTLPVALRLAAHDLGAPIESLNWLMEDFYEWATAGIYMDLPCANGERHPARVDVPSFDIHCDEADPHTETAHFLWALTQTGPPPCTSAGPVLNNWAGVSIPHQMGSSGDDRRTLLALRHVVRTVQYLDAGVSPRYYWDWLEDGTLAETVLALRRLARRHGKDINDYRSAVLGSLHNNSHADAFGDRAVQILSERFTNQARFEESRAKHRQDARARKKKQRQTPTDRSGRFGRKPTQLPNWAVNPPS